MMRRYAHYTITVYTNLYYVFAMGNWIPYRTSRDLAQDLDNRSRIDLIPPSDNNSVWDATQNRSDTDQFWLLRDDNATESTTMSQSDTIATEEENTRPVVNPVLQDDPEWMKEYEMNELIFLSRNNCNLELQIKEWEDRKLKIQYEKLKAGVSGRCQISLYGKNGIFLAVLVSNVHLNGKKSRQMSQAPTEVLKVVTRSHHFDYTLREYDGSEEYYPVMLTESNRVNIILLFNGTHPADARSSYNLEVFNYYKNENRINGTLQGESHLGYGNSSRYVNTIFITTAGPSVTSRKTSIIN